MSGAVDPVEDAGWSRWRLAGWVFAGALAVLLALFWQTALSMERTWRGSDSFQHTYVVPFILAYLVWEDRDRLAPHAPRTQWWGVPLILGASALWLVGSAAQVQVVEQLALIFMIQGLVLTVFGWAVVRVLMFPLLFMVFLVPMGDALVPMLQRWTAQFVVWSVRLFGIPTGTDGFLITLGAGNQPYMLFHVAKECSGIRYLTAMFQIGLLTAYLLFRSWPRRVAAVAVALVVPVLANWLRALGIVLLVYYTRGARGMDVDHIIYGFWFFLFVLAVYIGVCWLFAEPPPKRSHVHFSGRPAQGSYRRGLAAAAGLALLAAAAGPLYAVTLDRAVLRNPPPLAVPVRVDGWRRTAYLGVDWRPHYAGADAEAIGRYARDAELVDLYVARYDRQRQGAELVNTGNDLAGDGWDDTGERHDSTLNIDGTPTGVRYVRLVRGDRQRIVFYWYWVNGGIVSGDIKAKIETTAARLLGGTPGAAVVAVATDYQGDARRAARLVQAFIDALPPTTELAGMR
ncbi:MAG: EpsI family protein [Alphaproteobacteria bacterium]|nr:EpsI family protein [Alphaproteobacteria bacterium]